MERPNKCFIRQEWFEAVSFMSKEDRCDFYEGLLSFVYYGSQRDTPPPHIKGMLNLCISTLEKDIQSYTQKVITNRQNGSNGGRPREDITQKNPTEPNGTQKTHIYNIHKHIQNTTPYSLSTIPSQGVVSLESGEREKVILIEFFCRGCIEPLTETRKFIDYYDARGWVDKGGNPIVNIPALARVWKVQDESAYFANVRKKWGEFCSMLPNDMPHQICTDFVRLEQPKSTPEKLIIYCRRGELPTIIENNYLVYLRQFCGKIKAKSVEYRQEIVK